MEIWHQEELQRMRNGRCNVRVLDTQNNCTDKERMREGHQQWCHVRQIDKNTENGDFVCQCSKLEETKKIVFFHEFFSLLFYIVILNHCLRSSIGSSPAFLFASKYTVHLCHTHTHTLSLSLSSLSSYTEFIYRLIPFPWHSHILRRLDEKNFNIE